jgi:MFS family permease
VFQLRNLCLQLVSGTDASALLSDAFAGGRRGDRSDCRCDRPGWPDAGWLGRDKIHQRVANGRLLFAAISLIISTLCTAWALHSGRIEIGVFVAVFSLGWLFAYNFYTCVYTAIQDVVEPRLRATAMALFFAGLYLLGGGLGPVVVGALSDHFAHTAMLAAGAEQMTEAFKAVGLHDAMYLIPVALFFTMVFCSWLRGVLCAMPSG